MPFKIDSSDVRPIYIQIMDEIRRLIVRGGLKPDEALPSVRQMAVQLRLNPNTVAQAYKELEREGLVYVRRGFGTYVKSGIRSSREKEKLAHTVASMALAEARRNALTVDELVAAILNLSKPESGVNE